MKKIFVFLMVGLMVAATIATAAPAAKAEKEAADQPKGPVTHTQLAQLLVRALGLIRLLPTAPSVQQKFDVLMQNGISPLDGWLMDEILTKADLARVLVQALRMQDLVENPNDPQAWIDVLMAAGISLDRLSESIRAVEALPNGISVNAQMLSTDPIVYALPPDAIIYTVDAPTIFRIFTEIEAINGDFRPIPPTPH